MHIKCCIKKTNGYRESTRYQYYGQTKWKSYQITSTQHCKDLDHRRKGYKRIQICVNIIKTKCRNASKMDMQESCLMRKLTKQAKGLGICHTTQFSMNISQTKSELSLILQQRMIV